jgi:hypothetical protein
VPALGPKPKKGPAATADAHYTRHIAMLLDVAQTRRRQQFAHGLRLVVTVLQPEPPAGPQVSAATVVSPLLALLAGALLLVRRRVRQHG